MIKKLLIANRGEIACRIIKTARHMGITTIAIYSNADRLSPHVKLADIAYCVGEPTPINSYLNQDLILNIAQLAQVDAIHPGYGFLSEDPNFARKIVDNGLIFVGPSIQSMEIMASKQLTKQYLETQNIPLIPGYHGIEQTDNKLYQESLRLGLPVILKAAYGGGGKGMRIVHADEDWNLALNAARREAAAFFANDTLIIEKLLITPRHIEVQLMADNYGNIVHIFTRDCSIQRRNQKIIEEAPAQNISVELEHALTTAATNIAKAIKYVGAGTVEFLVDPDNNFYFLEMNTRLQVEHTVTEEITDIDLVAWQLHIAAHKPLPYTQESIKQQGHAIECRIYAEDAAGMPSSGTINFLQLPQIQGVRIDLGIHDKSTISTYYDALLAKVIAWGETREMAITKLQHALAQYYIGGVKTNLPLLKSIIHNSLFTQGTITTDYLKVADLKLQTIDPLWLIYYTACVDYLTLVQKTKPPIFLGWSLYTTKAWDVKYSIAEKNLSFTVSIMPLTPTSLQLQIEAQNPIELTILDYTNNQLQLDDGNKHHTVYVTTEENYWDIYINSEVYRINIDSNCTHNEEQIAQCELTSPIPAKIVSILVKQQDLVQQGQALIILEAMKIEHIIYAPFEGYVTEVLYPVGAKVPEGVELIQITQS